MTKNDNSDSYHLIAVIVICLFGIIIYSNTLKSSFVFDDLQNITLNPYIRLTNLDLEKILNAGFKSINSNRPLANISFAVNYYLGKYDVKGYHIVNIFIHIMNGILVYFLARITFKQLSDIGIFTTSKSPDFTISFISLFAALLFTAHPIQVQSVTYIVQRMNSMAAMFYFLSLTFYIYGRLSLTIWKRRAQWAGCFVSWILALGSKEIAVTLPLVLFLYEWYFFQDLSKEWLKQNLKYFIILVILLVPVAYMFLGPNPIDTLLGSYAYRDFTIIFKMGSFKKGMMCVLYGELVYLFCTQAIRLFYMRNIFLEFVLTNNNTYSYSLFPSFLAFSRYPHALFELTHD